MRKCFLMDCVAKGLERYFRFAEQGTTWRREALAGATTFLTMAYIIFVNPSILHDAGMPLAAVWVAWWLWAGLGGFLMGAFANYPLALAPGMGLNAYFAYTVVKGMGVPWQTALGAVFLSGVVFLLLTFAGIRQRLLAAIPHELHAAVAGGIGLFLALIGLQNAGIIVANRATMIGLGNLHAAGTALALGGIVLIALLQVLRVPGAILIGVLGTAVAGMACGQVHWSPVWVSPLAIRDVVFHLDVRGALHIGLWEIVFVFLFVDLFDNLGTLVAVTQRAGMMEADHTIPRLNRILLTDATATMFGAMAGTSTVVSYIESAAGVAAGGRTGATAMVTGVLFLLAVFVAPLVGAVPGFATAPALVLVGAMMMGAVGGIAWEKPRVALPAFLTLVMIPLSYSIATGLSVGVTSYAALELLSGKGSRRNWMLYLLAALFLARLIWLAEG